MNITLSGSDGSVNFPVLPASYRVSSAQNNSTVNVNAIGEVNLLGWPNLDEISWSSFFPYMVDESYSRSDAMTPYEYVQTITKMKAAGPCDLHLLDVMSAHVTIESFEWGEDDGTGDIHYSIDLKRYIYINSEGVVNKTLLQGGQGRPTPSSPRNGRNYITKAGDNLLIIARRELGTSDWSDIYRLNKNTIGSDPTVLTPGTKIILPR